MKFDTVIIGGGLAGLVCGIALAQRKQSCAIISTGQSALHFSSGSLDLLNRLPDGQSVEHPLQALPQLAEQAPQHPYNRFSVVEFEQLSTQAQTLLRDAGLALEGSAQRNHYRLSPIGAALPTWLSLQDVPTLETADLLPWKRIVVASFRGFLDFQPQVMVDRLHAFGATVTLSLLHLPELDRLRSNPSEFRSIQLARLLEQPQPLQALEQALRSSCMEGDVILLPACLGLENTQALTELSKRLNKPIFQLPTLPPSLLGLRIHNVLSRTFRSLGGQLMVGDRILRADIEGQRVNQIYSQNHTDIPFRADQFVLASGSFFSRGLVAEKGSMREPVFDLDMDYTNDRNQWSDMDFFAPHAFLQYGVKTDAQFRAFKNGVALENLAVAGAILNGFDPLHQGCGGGVSLLSALAIANRIGEKS